MSSRLTLAYLEHAPRSAGEVLQTLETAQAAAFLETVPARLAAPVVNSMIPWGAARCMEQLSAPRAAGILRALVFHDGASLLRLIRAELRDPILEELPSTLARRLGSSLQYPLSQVGAWLEPDVPVLRDSDTVQDALKLIGFSLVTTSHIFVESADDGRFMGSLSARDLLGSEPSVALSQLPIARIEPVSNRVSLTTVAFDERWDECLFLPVVGRRGTVLGGLSRSALRKGIHEQHLHTEAHAKSVLGHLLSAFLVACTGMFRLAARASLAEPVQATGGSNRAR